MLDKNRLEKGVHSRNIEKINYKVGFHDIKAGDVFIPDDALEDIFGGLKEYVIEIDGEVLKSLRIPEWKLNYQFMKVLQLLWEEPEKDAEYLETVIEESYEAEDTFVDETPRISKQIEILKHRMAVLVDKYLDGMITEDIYNEKYNDLKLKIEAFEIELQEAKVQVEEHQSRAVTEEEKVEMLDSVRVQLEAMVEITKGKLDETAIQSLVPALIDRVTPTESGEFRWYLSLGGETPTVGFGEKNYVLLHELTVTYSEARAHRKSTGSYLRVRQWQDLDMKVFVRG